MTSTIGLALLMSGCASGPLDSGTPAELPAAVTDDVFTSDSVRYLGEDSNGSAYYAAKNANNSEECLIVITTDDWASGCGRLPVKVTISDTDATLAKEPLSDDAPGEHVGDYVTVSTSP
ncbi:hypothetical protein [Microbacterium flavescens]|uniref:hypothetical protein n=1 Tax=Microbacterium flavescens TaxID=69366 RepID=UPI001BDE68A9|nr:hypothetical protein [Microbacterium flavescens]